MAVVVEKTNTIEIRMIAESVYDSPDSEGENYEIKQVYVYRSDDPDYCGTFNDNYNTLRTMKCRDLREIYQSTFTDEIPTKIPATNFRNLSSLQQGRCMDATCLNDWAKHFINVWNLSHSVLYIPTNLYTCFFKDKISDSEAENLTRYLANNKALNKDYILVGIPAAPNSQLWTLGVILLNTRKITLLDPINYSPSINSCHYSNLLKITLLAHKLAGVELNLEQWQLFYPLNIPRTDKKVDSGIYVCYYIFKIALRQVLSSLLDTTPREFRRRIHYVLSSAREIFPQGDSKRYPREKFQQYYQCFNQDFAPFSQYLFTQSFDAIAFNSVPNLSLRGCADSMCGQSMTGDVNQVLCISCRAYHHVKCAGVDPEVDYFNCAICSALYFTPE